MPTILELASLDSAPKTGAPKFPGESMASTFRNETTSQSRDVWWCHDGHRAYRSGNWKIVSLKDNIWELYDLSKDPTETTDLSTNHPEKVASLEKRWQAQLQDFQQHLPKPAPGKKKKVRR